MTRRRDEDDVEDGLLRLHLPTIRRLHAQAQSEAEKSGWSYRDFLARLVSEALAHRAETRVQRATRKALGRFLGPELVSEARSVILLGQPGRGKTHLAIAFAYKAIKNGYEARFTTATALLDELHRAARSCACAARATAPAASVSSRRKSRAPEPCWLVVTSSPRRERTGPLPQTPGFDALGHPPEAKEARAAAWCAAARLLGCWPQDGARVASPQSPTLRLGARDRSDGGAVRHRRVRRPRLPVPARYPAHRPDFPEPTMASPR